MPSYACPGRPPVPRRVSPARRLSPTACPQTYACPRPPVPRRTPVPDRLSPDACPRPPVPRRLYPRPPVPRRLSSTACPQTLVPDRLSPDACPRPPVPQTPTSPPPRAPVPRRLRPRDRLSPDHACPRPPIMSPTACPQTPAVPDRLLQLRLVLRSSPFEPMSRGPLSPLANPHSLPFRSVVVGRSNRQNWQKASYIGDTVRSGGHAVMCKQTWPGPASARAAGCLARKTDHTTSRRPWGGSQPAHALRVAARQRPPEIPCHQLLLRLLLPPPAPAADLPQALLPCPSLPCRRRRAPPLRPHLDRGPHTAAVSRIGQGRVVPPTESTGRFGLRFHEHSPMPFHARDIIDCGVSKDDNDPNMIDTGDRRRPALRSVNCLFMHAACAVRQR